jgi:ferric-dicitrate binding protein FerR (iron transport regulator)
MDFDKNRLLELIAGVLEGDLTEADRVSLNSILRESPDARQVYLQHTHLHTRLHLDYTAGQVTDFMPGATSPKKSSRFSGIQFTIMAAAACLVLMALFSLLRPSGTNAFATLEQAKSVRWGSSDLPTTEGARLGGGTLRVAEGLVTLRFDSGAEITLEAPAELTLVDEMHCILLSGAAVTYVPDSAVGFRVKTPYADVVDFGTRFSVIVNSITNKTYTEVYEGLVEVEHPKTGKVVSLRAGQRISSGIESMNEVLQEQDGFDWPVTIGPAMRDSEWKSFETTKDAYIGRAFIDNVEVHRSETLLLVKNGSVPRYSCLGFDLSDLAPDQISDATLKLNFAPTGLGLASHVPDATFSVYGLIANQTWNEDSINEGNAPAFAPNRFIGDGLDKSKLRKLGSFVIEQGVQRGEFGIEGEALATFLRDHAGSAITLIVGRDTKEIERDGLVHGFASRRHPTLPPPTLLIRVEKAGD